MKKTILLIISTLILGCSKDDTNYPNPNNCPTVKQLTSVGYAVRHDSAIGTYNVQIYYLKLSNDSVIVLDQQQAIAWHTGMPYCR